MLVRIGFYIHYRAEFNSTFAGNAGMYHQFRFSVGSPQAEAKFQAAVQTAIATDANAKRHPTLYVGSFLTLFGG